MLEILNITDETTKPTLNITLSNGEISFELRLQYLPYINLWTMGLTYNDFIIEGLKIVSFTNLLQQYRYRLSFGLFVYSEKYYEPVLPNDFATKKTRLIVIEPDEVNTFNPLDFYPKDI